MSKLLDKCIEYACKIHNNNTQNYNVYAFIFDKNKLLSVGHNNMVQTSGRAYRLGKKFNIEQFKKYPFKHAELDAVSKLWGKKMITGKEALITVRLKKDYSLGNAKPCGDCMTLIHALGITKLEWTV